MKTHQFHKHEYRHPLHFKFRSGICPGCDRNVHFRKGVFKHLMRKSISQCCNAYGYEVLMSKPHLDDFDMVVKAVDNKPMFPPVV